MAVGRAFRTGRVVDEIAGICLHYLTKTLLPLSPPVLTSAA